MPTHAGEDLFSTLLAVALLLVFVAALTHSYHTYAERKNSADDFETALGAAERLRDKYLASPNGAPGLIELSQEGAESSVRALELNGLSLRVEIVSLDGELLLAAGPVPNAIGDYLSPAAGASLPVAARCENGSVRLAELVVRIWSG